MNLINPSHRQFLSLPVRTQCAFFRYLLAFNQKVEPRTGAAEKASLSFHREHHQLPCSLETRRRRALLFLEMGFQHKNVCLLGDDDLVSVDLMELGFTQVTVYDCDPKILMRIAQAIPENQKAGIALKQVDFRQLQDLRPGFADLVCLDPPYHREGVQLFLKAAFVCSKRDVDSRIIMMTIPLLFQNSRDDWKDIERLLRSENFQLIQRHEGFNAYPLNPASRFSLFMVSRAIGRRKSGLQFFSDCLIWAFKHKTLDSEISRVPAPGSPEPG